MAFNAATAWDVRTSGNDANGGGFQVGATGTNYAQQDGPQFTYTDLVIDGTTNTKITSAAHPFDSNSPGNVINITSGSGFTVQRVQIVSVSGSTATCDKAVGTLGSTGGNGNLGGGLLTLAAANALIVTGNSVFVKTGTYTLTAAVAIGSSIVSHWVGYGSAHGDNGTRPLITTATNSTQLFTGTIATAVTFVNISFSNTASTRGDCFRAVSNYPIVYFVGCLLDGFDKGINADNGSSTSVTTLISVINSEIKNCVTAAITTFQFATHVQGSYIHDNVQDGIVLNGGNPSLTVVNSVLAKNGRYAIYRPSFASTFVALINVGFYNNGLTFTGHPFSAIFGAATFAASAVNCIFYGGAAAYMGNTGGIDIMQGRCNAIDSQGMGASSVVDYTSSGDVTLTADPFTSGAGADYTLNATAGGGAACKLLGSPGTSPAGTGNLDIGPIQTSGGGGGSSAGPFSRIFSGY